MKKLISFLLVLGLSVSAVSADEFDIEIQYQNCLKSTPSANFMRTCDLVKKRDLKYYNLFSRQKADTEKKFCMLSCLKDAKKKYESEGQITLFAKFDECRYKGVKRREHLSSL